MIIIIEGADSVGKSTVAHELQKMIPLSNLLKLSGAPKHEKGSSYMEKVYSQLTRFLTFVGNNGHIILDRFCTSERVYSTLFKDYYPDYLDNYETYLKDRVPIKQFVLYFEDEKEIEKRLEQKRKESPNEKHGDFETIARVNEQYFDVALTGETKFDTTLIKVDGLDVGSIAKLILHETGIIAELDEKDDTYGELRKGDAE